MLHLKPSQLHSLFLIFKVNLSIHTKTKVIINAIRFIKSPYNKLDGEKIIPPCHARMKKEASQEFAQLMRSLR